MNQCSHVQCFNFYTLQLVISPIDLECGLTLLHEFGSFDALLYLLLVLYMPLTSKCFVQASPIVVEPLRILPTKKKQFCKRKHELDIRFSMQEPLYIRMTWWRSVGLVVAMSWRFCVGVEIVFFYVVKTITTI